jgi:nicotinate phosphoribosyltransferase
LDSALTRENILRARALLDELGATHTKIYVSGGMDENSIAALGSVPIDGYGVGERIVTSPDAPVGVGAVGKLSLIGGRPTMKLSRGSGKATLPGRLQCWRSRRGDLIGLDDEDVEGTALLQPVWAEHGRLPGPDLHAARAHAAQSLSALPAQQRVPRVPAIRVTERLASLVEQLVVEGTR